jgi:hypothetical protein
LSQTAVPKLIATDKSDPSPTRFYQCPTQKVFTAGQPNIFLRTRVCLIEIRFHCEMIWVCVVKIIIVVLKKMYVVPACNFDLVHLSPKDLAPIPRLKNKPNKETSSINCNYQKFPKISNLRQTNESKNGFFYSTVLILYVNFYN